MPIRILLILGAFLLSVLMWVDRACISAAKGDMAADLGFSDQQMGWVMSAFALGYALFQVPSGKLADRFGPRIVMTSVCLIWSAFTALTGVVRGLYLMIGLRFFFGMGEAGGYPTLTRAFTSWLPMNERGITNSISFSGGRLGAALAMPGVVWLIGTLGGWQQTFWFFGVIGIVFAVLWFLLFRNTPEEHFAVSQRERDYIVERRKPPKTTTESSSVELTEIRFAEMLRSRNLLMLMVQYVAHNFTFFFTVTWFFPYLKESFSLTNEQTGWYAAAPLLCGVVGNWMAGFTVDRLYSRGQWQLSRRLPAAIGFLLAAIGMSLCVNMNSPGLAVACMCIAIFGSDMILSPSWSTCMDIGGSNAGAVSGSMNMVGNLGSFFTALSFPYLHAALGSHKPFFYLAAGLNVLAIFMWFKIRPDQSIQDELRVGAE
ncbi:MFS transporter [Novipirellula artificiosorum]|uniref:Putative sulfoacetate transporter SauU n=1 Tax=Novipirellula artificiosorum TaxID=2528016 RepID=A0A5C6DQM2_9BACT|nr:MFS transporter [Novipirellula artificiosorum]TWU38474.1 putative sulfoacetate transporter SauU [Novipirellula artificiosorum]